MSSRRRTRRPPATPGASPAPRQTAQADAGTTDNIERVIWDSTPSRLPGWLIKKRKLLRSANSKFTTLVQYYYVITPKTICCMSLNHIDRILDKSFPKGSFEDPAYVKRDDLVDLGPIVRGLPTTPAAEGKSVKADKPSTARYVEQPESVEELDLELMEDILMDISDVDTADTWRAVADESGCKLLIELQKRCVEIFADSSANFGLDIEQEFNDHIAAGIPTPTTVDYLEFKSTANALRRPLEQTDYVVSDPQFASKLAQAARNLGAFVSARIDTEIRITSARGNLAKTHDAITLVLDQLEVEARQSGGDFGSALIAAAGGDPNRYGGRGRGDCNRTSIRLTSSSVVRTRASSERSFIVPLTRAPTSATRSRCFAVRWPGRPRRSCWTRSALSAICTTRASWDYATSDRIPRSSA